MKYSIVCTACGQKEKNSIVICSSCFNGLEINYKRESKKGKLEDLLEGCYLPFDNKINVFPNSQTPVVQLQGENIFAKLEYSNVSLSAKDREAFVEIMMAQQLGYKGIAVASTGNMGGALASICALVKFPCFVFIPKDTSEIKVKQIQQFGAILKKIDGVYDDIISEVKMFAEKEHFFLASLQAFRFEGYKTISYEIYEKFGEKLPENIIIPLGDGTTYVAVWKGFEDLKSLGLIEEYPHLIGVQAKQCDPIVTAYRENKPIKIIKNPQTLAKAIRIGNPLDGDYAIKVSKLTKGSMFSYTEDQIINAYKLLLKESINAEYASALTYCPVIFNNMKNALLLITGSGSKN